MNTNQTRMQREGAGLPLAASQRNPLSEAFFFAKPQAAGAWIVLIALLTFCGAAQGATQFDQPFAPSDGIVADVEKPARDERCLNGAWQFQPAAVPADYRRDAGEPPALPDPVAERWEPTPIRIPSPWNANTWGNGRDVGVGTPRPYWADSVYFPSYPPAWDGAEMGWLRRRFRVPAGWADRGGKRLILRFEAVAGDCRVLVNGRAAGSHGLDAYTPFDLDVTDLVKRDSENELLVGVRARRLSDQTSERFPKFRAPYPIGSNTDQLVGIWQDVYLLAVPTVRAAEVFVKPLVDQDVLEVEATLRNDSADARTVTVGGDVRPWVNLAPANDPVESPVPKWRLDAGVLRVPPQSVALAAGEAKAVTLCVPVAAGQLRFWSPRTPNLYGLVLTIQAVDGSSLDTKYTRFGWRQFTIHGPDLLLNGEPIKLVGDLCHPFGPFMMSRRFAWAWYAMIRDMGGNAVRPHAQPYPRCFLDLADEMGLCVLDESALFGSSIQLNFEQPAAWERFAAHLAALVRRDRNHPSVFGWSVGNELFAIFDYNDVPPEKAAEWYGKLADLARGVEKLDPTRPWISCDGDGDLHGALPVWSKHFGLGLPPADALPAVAGKPLMVGESGGSYYATPAQLSAFNGPRAYANYTGRNEALAIDAYQNVAQLARPRLAYFSISEVVWFGLEPLPFGYSDVSRLPTRDDGVFFTAPFQEGKPGMQIERLPPYVGTLNPGWDKSLPPYRPLALFDAVKAATSGAASPWDHEHLDSPATKPATRPTPVPLVGFAGERDGATFHALQSLGVPLAKPGENAPLLIVDAGHLAAADVEAAKRQMQAVTDAGGTALALFDGPAPDGLLPTAVTLTDRTATMLDPKAPSPWTAGLTAADLYFAEDSVDKLVLKRGLAGPLVDRGDVLLAASDTDWSLFNNQPEAAKCGAVVLYEHLRKPAGAALVRVPAGRGQLLLCAIDLNLASPARVTLWRRLLTNGGVTLAEPPNAWLLPTAAASAEGVAWRYTTAPPPANWADAAFDDSAWKVGRGGFGGKVPNSRPRTDWATDDLWLRRTVALSAADVKAAADLKLVLHHDEDAEVYLNGTQILSRPGFTTRYEAIPLPPAAAKLLRVGENVLAVHCHQIEGGQYLDLGLARDAVPPESLEPDGPAHNLLLNGPPGGGK